MRATSETERPRKLSRQITKHFAEIGKFVAQFTLSMAAPMVEGKLRSRSVWPVGAVSKTITS